MWQFIKENLVFILAGVLILAFLGTIAYDNWKEGNQDSEAQTSQTSSPSTEETSAEAEPETTDEKNYRTAKLKLEHPYSESTEEEKNQVAAAFDTALSSIKAAKTLDKVTATIDNHLSMSDTAMVQTFAMAILINDYSYEPSQLEVTESDSTDVVQFLVVLTKDGEDTCYFVGNFNTTVHQIQLKSYIGGNIGGTFG